jgi:hypothetical protein
MPDPQTDGSAPPPLPPIGSDLTDFHARQASGTALPPLPPIGSDLTAWRQGTPPAPAPDYGYGNRYNSTEPKGLGYFGPLQRPDGTGIMGEFSVGLPINGKEMEVPSMVPTLTHDELVAILRAKEGEPLPASIYQKAGAYAQQRLAAGRSVWAQPGEQSDAYPDLPRAPIPPIRNAASLPPLPPIGSDLTAFHSKQASPPRPPPMVATGFTDPNSVQVTTPPAPAPSFFDRLGSVGDPEAGGGPIAAPAAASLVKRTVTGPGRMVQAVRTALTPPPLESHPLGTPPIAQPDAGPTQEDIDQYAKVGAPPPMRLKDAQLDAGSEFLEGAMDTATPLLLAGGIVAPARTALVVALTAIAQHGGAGATAALGGSPSAQRLVGNIAATATATGVGSDQLQRYAADQLRVLTDTGKAMARPLVLSGQLYAAGVDAGDLRGGGRGPGFVDPGIPEAAPSADTRPTNVTPSPLAELPTAQLIDIAETARHPANAETAQAELVRRGELAPGVDDEIAAASNADLVTMRQSPDPATRDAAFAETERRLLEARQRLTDAGATPSVSPQQAAAPETPTPALPPVGSDLTAFHAQQAETAPEQPTRPDHVAPGITRTSPDTRPILDAIASTADQDAFVVAGGKRLRVAQSNYGMFGRHIGGDIQLADHSEISVDLVDRVEDAEGNVLWRKASALPPVGSDLTTFHAQQGETAPGAPTLPPVGSDLTAFHAEESSVAAPEQPAAFQPVDRVLRNGQPATVLDPALKGDQVRVRVDGEGFERRVDPKAITPNVSVTTLGGADARPSEAGTSAAGTGRLAPDGGPERPAAPQGGIQPKGQRAPRRQGGPRYTRTPAQQEADTLDDLVDAAKRDGYQGEDTALRIELRDRLALIKELDDEFARVGRSPHALLQAIAKRGGISVTEEGALKGEIKWLKEFQTNFGTTLHPRTGFGQVGGVNGVFNRSGRSVDDILTSLRQDQQWRHLETHSDLIEAIRSAATAEAPQQAAETLKRGLGERWWADIGTARMRHEEVLPPEPEPELAADEYGDISFNPEELERPRTIWKGDDAEYTGHVEHHAGGTFYEIRLLEGHLQGQTKLTPHAPPSTTADVLPTGEVQPRLPEAGAVRDHDQPTPQFDAPFSLSGEANTTPSATPRDLFAEREREMRTPEEGDPRATVDRELETLAERLRPVHGAIEARAAAQAFLRQPIRNLETGLVASVSRQSLDKMLSKSAVDRSTSSQAHVLAVGNLDTLFRLATLRESRASKKAPETIGAIHHFDVPMPLAGDVLQVKILAKAFRRPIDGVRIYLVEAVQIGAPGLEERGQTSSRSSGRSSPSLPDAASDRFAEMVETVKRGTAASDEPEHEMRAPAVVTAAVRTAAAGVQQAHAAIYGTLAAPSVSHPARASSRQFSERIAQYTQTVEHATRALEPFRRALEGMTVDHAAILDLADAIEGVPGATLPDWLKTWARVRQPIFDRLKRQIAALGIEKDWHQYYLGHIWETEFQADGPTLTQRTLARLIGRRPLQGPKSFTKRRTIPTMREGVEHFKKTPKTWNLVDIDLYKIAEMGKYILGRQTLADNKAMGTWTFHTALKKPPAGLAAIPDPIGDVWAPAEITVAEAYDKLLMEGLENFIRGLGVQYSRETGAGRTWGSANAKTGDVTARFGGPPEVLMHEVGHTLDTLFGLYDRIATTLKTPEFPGDKSTLRELRTLAELRYAGVQPDASFKRYVQTHEEQIANLVHAYLYAPQMARRVAPHAYDALDDLIASIPALAPLEDLQQMRGLVLGTRESTQKLPGPMLLGRYYADPSVARLFTNYLTPGWAGNAVWQAVRIPANALVQARLAVSGFHAFAITLASAAMEAGRGISDVARGKPAGVARLGTALAEPVNVVRRGHQIRERYLTTLDPLSLAVDDAVNHLMAGGGRVQQSAEYTNRSVRSFTNALRRANGAFTRQLYGRAGWEAASAAVRLLPALVEAGAYPILGYLVPVVKAGTATEQIRSDLARLPGTPTHATLLAIANKAVKLTDATMGEVIWDNYFLPRALMSAIHMVIMAPGWRGGSAVLLVRGLTDPVRRLIPGQREAYQVYPRAGGAPPGTPPHPPGSPVSGVTAKGAPINVLEPYWSPYASLLIGLAFIQVLVSEIYQQAHGAGHVKTLHDVVYPRTGKVGADGKPERVVLPGYAGIFYDLLRDLPKSILEYALGGTAPIPTLIGQLYHNETRFGDEIADPADPWRAQLLEYTHFLEGQFAPISVSSYGRRAGTPAEKAESVLGISPSPARVNRSPAEAYLHDIAPPPHRTLDEVKKATERRDVRTALQAKDLAALRTAVQEGELSARALRETLRRSQLVTLQREFKAATLAQATHAMELASPEERYTLKALYIAKAKAALAPGTVAPAEARTLIDGVRRALALPVSRPAPVAAGASR